MQSSEAPKTNKTWALPSEDLHHDSKSTPYPCKRFCPENLLDFCPKISTNGHEDCILSREYDINGNPLCYALNNLTWWPYLPTYSPPKISSPATVPFDSFHMHLWSELLSLSSHPSLTQPPRSSLSSYLLWYILSAMVTWKLNKACMPPVLLNDFFTIILALCSYSALGQPDSHFLGQFSFVRVETVSYPSLYLPTGLAHNWNSLGQMKKVLFKMRDLLKSGRCQLKWSVYDKNLQSISFSNSFSCWLSNIYANGNQEKHRCWTCTKLKTNSSQPILFTKLSIRASNKRLRHHWPLFLSQVQTISGRSKVPWSEGTRGRWQRKGEKAKDLKIKDDV